MEHHIVIHGGGYVGLTAAVHYAAAEFLVTILDLDQNVVDAINCGRPRAGEYLSYIDRDVAYYVEQGMIRSTSSFEEIELKPVHFLAVPTEKDGEPYMDIVKESLCKLDISVPKGGLVVVESTLTPGTIKSFLSQYICARLGDTVHLAVSPRLDWFADKEKNMANLPKIIGGVTPACTAKAREIISKVCSDIYETTADVAELVKAGQNALYFAQIVTAHEMALHYPHVDMNEVLRLISTHWRIPTLFLGPGVSGRCVPSGAKYLDAGAKHGFYRMKDLLNAETRWRQTIADALVAHLPKLTAQILILGIAYRANFTDIGYSAGLGIAKHLNEHGWKAYVHDCCVSQDVLDKVSKECPIGHYSQFHDAILLATAHDEYLDLPECSMFRNGQIVLDATGAWEKYRSRFEQRSIKYIRVGEPFWLP